LAGFRDGAVVAAYKLGSRLACAVPDSVARGTGRVLGAAMSRADGERRRVVTANLRRITGRSPSTAEVRAAFDSYARYWVELFRLPRVTATELDAGITVDGLEHLDAALAAGKGAVVALPHLGGWEWGGAWLATVGRPMTVVVEPLDPPELLAWFVEKREAMGLQVVPLGPSAAASVMKALGDNRLVGLVCDRDINGGGVEVEFFGERTTMPAGPVTMALRAGSPVLPTAVYFEGDRHRAVVRPPLELTRHGRLRDDVARITQVLACELEDLIRAAPEQWHVFQPNWPSDRISSR
jgi:lauroyl/myristoyl acyltransferase